MPHLSRNDTKLIIELLRAECRSDVSGKRPEALLLRRLETRMAQSAFTLGQVKTARDKPLATRREERQGARQATRVQAE